MDDGWVVRIMRMKEYENVREMKYQRKRRKKKTKFQRVEVRLWGLKRKKKKESTERNDEPWSITLVVVKPIF